MTVETFLTLLLACSVVTSLVTEAVKKLLDSIHVKYVTNVVVLFVSIIVGGAIAGIYCTMVETVLFNNLFIFISVVIVANWLVAMLGYDKIVQTITQFKTNTENK